MSLRARLASLTRAQQVASSIALALVVYAALGFLALPPLARRIALDSIRETFGRDARVGDVRINPFLLTLDVEGFRLPDRDGSEFVSFSALHVDFELASIFHRAFTFAEVRLVEPFVHVKVLENGDLNFGDMVEVLLAEEEGENDADESGAPPVLVQLASISAGRVLFSDLSRETDFEYEISPLDIEVRDFGTRPDDESPYSFTATTGAGESLAWEGSISVVPLYSKGRIELTGVRPRTGWLYVQDDVFFEVVDGTIDVEASYDLDAREGLVLRLDEGEIRVRDFKVADRDTGEVAMSIESFDVTGIEVGYPEQSLHVTSMRSRGGRHHALRLEDGSFRIEQLARARGEEAASAAPEALPAEEATGGDWSVVIDEIEVTEHRIDYEDRSTRPPVAVTLAPIAVRLRDVRTDPTHPIEASLDVGLEEGRLSISGRGQAEPAGAELDIVVDALDLRAFEPYWLPLARVDMTSGLLGVDGHLSASVPPTGAPRVGWAGDVGLDALRTVDQRLGAQLVSWASLELSALEIDSAAPSLSIEELRLVKPTAHLVISPDGTTNVSNVAVEGAGDGADDEAPVSGPSPSIRIDLIEIVGGRASFEDRSISPLYQTGISGLDGSIAGLSSSAKSRARVDLEGRLEGATPMRIDGEVSPVADDTYVDLRLDVDNFELAPLSPYSGRHIGQAIARGKLFLELEYVLEGSSIRGENELFLDQFTLGDRVESDEAINLPVGLAIALLKDRNGEIHIDLPVRGDVDDPEFSVGKLIFGALGNLITKVALSPFAMLGGLGGGGDEAPSAIDFAYGGAALASAEASKLDALATALNERPALSLELRGASRTALDRPVLQADALEVELERERLRELQARWFGDKPESIDDVVLEPKQRRRLLEKRWQVVFGEKAKQGVTPPIDTLTEAELVAVDDAARSQAWLATLERRLAAEIDVDEGTLRGLAKRRSQTVREYLVQSAGIPAERVYVLDVVIDDPELADGVGTVLSLAAH